MTTVMAPARPLTQRSALALAKAIREGEVSSREVVEAHIARLRARAAARSTRSPPSASTPRCEEADAADRRVAEAPDRDDLPPLLGVPCTIKESIALAGMPNCAGLLAAASTGREETAPTAARLRRAPARSRSASPTPPS